MSDKQKNSKAGRQKKSGQNLRYKNERRAEQSQLRRLKTHIKGHGVTAEVRDTIRRLQIVLGHSPSDLKVDRPKARSNASIAFHKRPDARMHRAQMRDISLGYRKAA